MGTLTATPRHLLVDEAHPGAYHLISRCVRRAYLCGDACAHRRAWVEGGIETQAAAFAVDILAFAVRSNHLYIVCRTDPEAAQAWSDREVVERWARLFPARDPATDHAVAWDPEDIDAMAKRPDWVATRRARLASRSWFMRLLKQRIARRANREDGVTGHFWEGRFQSVRLLDQTGRLLREGKRGIIPTHLQPILDRLRIDTDRWLAVMLSHGSFLGTAVGTITALAKEALRRGVRWVADQTRLRRERREIAA